MTLAHLSHRVSQIKWANTPRRYLMVARGSCMVLDRLCCGKMTVRPRVSHPWHLGSSTLASARRLQYCMQPAAIPSEQFRAKKLSVRFLHSEIRGDHPGVG